MGRNPTHSEIRRQRPPSIICFHGTLPVRVKPLRLSGEMCLGMGPSTQQEQATAKSASPGGLDKAW